MYCECGCGKMVKFGRGARFVPYHFSRTEEHKRGVVATHKGKVTSEETKQKQRKVAEGRDMSVPIKAAAEAHRGGRASLETKRKMSKSQKRLWADPIFHERQQSRMAYGSRIQRPNKPETKLLNLLDHQFPGDWKYVGDGSFVINGKNPDFINVNGKKQIIEVWGNHWHRGQNPDDRIAIFEPYGYCTLIVWEYELKHMPRLIKRISEFVNH